MSIAWTIAFRQRIQSVEATGGVYKGQGHILYKIVTFTYKGFRVHDKPLQISITTTAQFS